MDKEWMGAGDVAGWLNLPLSWVYMAAESGRLPSHKLGKYRRFRRSEIEKWLASQREKPVAAREA